MEQSFIKLAIVNIDSIYSLGYGEYTIYDGSIDSILVASCMAFCMHWVPSHSSYSYFMQILIINYSYDINPFSYRS